MDREARLGQLASDILDGRPIDWHTEESTADAADGPVLEQLQVLAEIAALHRRLSDDAPTIELEDGKEPAAWGHLRLLERVGSGTFGEVFRAWDTHLDREVALKLLRAAPAPGDAAASLSDPARIVNEGRLLARVRHPHVITVYGAEPRDGNVGVWMEFIRGRTLQQIIDAQGPMSAREAAAVGTDLCRALAAVHAAGLLHRDVSARNVMRGEGGRIVLMDFGAGHDQLGDPHAAGERDIAGTPVYMAPELFVGQPADRRTDIYALGVLMFYLVSGRFPVAGRSLAEIGEAHAEGRRTPVRDVRPDLPPGFVRVIEHALDAEPLRRIQSAGALETALARAFDVDDRSASRGGRLGWKSVAGLAAAGLAAVAGVWFASGRLSVEKPASPTPPANLAAASGLAVRQLFAFPSEFWPFSNPSADGRFMAGMMTGTGDVGLIDLTTRQYRALGMQAGNNGYASLGALSPDGTWVAVDWYEGPHGSLRVIRSDGTGLRTLVLPPGDVSVHGWSPDNAMILAVLAGVDGRPMIALVAASDGAIRPLRTLERGQPEKASLSPDGRYIAYDYPESDDTVDRDILILDTHTGEQWPLGPSPGQDSAPFWLPDGSGIVFVSDRNRIPSLWLVPVERGRAAGEPVLVRDNIGRVWLRGFTATGVLHYHAWAGYAEVYVASLDTPDRPPRPLSPRQALSNFYPTWSPDGCCVAYASERGVGSGRDLWVYDTQSQRETRVASPRGLGRPVAWSPDSRQILVSGADGQRLSIIDRATGQGRQVAEHATQPAWGPAGIVYVTQKRVVIHDAGTGRAVKAFEFDDPAVSGFHPSRDGRSVMALYRNGRIVLHDLRSMRTHEWQETAGARLHRFQGRHAMPPHAPGAAYVVFRPGVNGETQSLMFWGGSGSPRELLRVSGSEQFLLAGWYGDGLSLLVVRWTNPAPGSPAGADRRTMWRVPITGGQPTAVGTPMESLRDFTFHPDGRQIAFNVGFKRSDLWVMENLR